MESILTNLIENDVREQFAFLIEITIEHNGVFFDELRKSSKEVKGSSRREVILTDKLKKEAKALRDLLARAADELVFESETYTIEHYLLHIVDEYIDRTEYSLDLFLNTKNVITWLEGGQSNLTLVIMPRTVQEILNEQVFSKKQPYIFSSATLSENDSFQYIADSLGIGDYLSFSVESPFEYKSQMRIFIPNRLEELSAEEKSLLTIEQISQTKGRAIVLFNAKEDLNFHFGKWTYHICFYGFVKE